MDCRNFWYFNNLSNLQKPYNDTYIDYKSFYLEVFKNDKTLFDARPGLAFAYWPNTRVIKLRNSFF